MAKKEKYTTFKTDIRLLLTVICLYGIMIIIYVNMDSEFSFFSQIATLIMLFIGFMIYVMIISVTKKKKYGKYKKKEDN